MGERKRSNGASRTMRPMGSWGGGIGIKAGNRIMGPVRTVGPVRTLGASKDPGD